MLVWAVWCYPDTCLELLKVIWSWAVFPDVKQVRGACPCQGIRPTGKGTPAQEVRVFLAFYVLMPLCKGRKCIYALRESSKAWQVI